MLSSSPPPTPKSSAAQPELTFLSQLPPSSLCAVIKRNRGSRRFAKKPEKGISHVSELRLRAQVLPPD